MAIWPFPLEKGPFHCPRRESSRKRVTCPSRFPEARTREREGGEDNDDGWRYGMQQQAVGKAQPRMQVISGAFSHWGSSLNQGSPHRGSSLTIIAPLCHSDSRFTFIIILITIIFLQSIVAINFILFSRSLRLSSHNGKGTPQLTFIFSPLQKKVPSFFLLRVFSYFRHEHHKRQKMFLQEAVVAGFDPSWSEGRYYPANLFHFEDLYAHIIMMVTIYDKEDNSSNVENAEDPLALFIWKFSRTENTHKREG